MQLMVGIREAVDVDVPRPITWGRKGRTYKMIHLFQVLEAGQVWSATHVKLPLLQGGNRSVAIEEAEDDSVQEGLPPPVVVVALHRQELVGNQLGAFEGSGPDGHARERLVVNNLIERDVLEHVLGRDVHSGVRAGNEIKVGCLQLEAHGVFVNLLGAGEILHCPTVFPQVLGPLDLRQPAALACDIPVGGCEPAPHHVVGSERPAIVPFDVLAQVEHPYPIRLLNVHLLGQLRCDLELFRLGRQAVAPLLTPDKRL